MKLSISSIVMRTKYHNGPSGRASKTIGVDDDEWVADRKLPYHVQAIRA